MSLHPLWPTQVTGIAGVHNAIARGQRRICLTSPTGGGKTRMMAELARHYTEQNAKVCLYTNRRLLFAQLVKDMEGFGFEVGMRISGEVTNSEALLQISSIPTEIARTHKRNLWEMVNASLVFVDEAHLQKGDQARKVIDAHHAAGAIIVGVTATPLDLEGIYQHLVQAGTTSDLRACGALVPCHHFAPDEPDIKRLKVPLGKDLSENQIKSVIMTQGIFGRVFTNWERLNPEHKPTILFAPGVPESVWFAEQFWANGVTAAHIDGQEVWINGKFVRGNKDRLRKEVLELSQCGGIKVLCNRYVLREGIDAPWLAHGIFATIFGGIGSYLQSGGRLLRSHPSLSHVTLQDHGGNWWRHGSLNADRIWSLGLTNDYLCNRREDDLRAKREREPRRCPKCTQVLAGDKCPCGYQLPQREKSRPVVQSDGTLKEMVGDIFGPRRITTRPDGPSIWKKMYYRSKTDKGAKTFRAAMALFAYENNFGWPNPDWPFMPRYTDDFYRLVKDVPEENLL